MITQQFFKSLELYFVFTYQRIFIGKRLVLKIYPDQDFGPLLVDRPSTIGRANCSVGRPGGRPICTKVQVCTSVDQASSRPLEPPNAYKYPCKDLRGKEISEQARFSLFQLQSKIFFLLLFCIFFRSCSRAELILERERY